MSALFITCLAGGFLLIVGLLATYLRAYKHGFSEGLKYSKLLGDKDNVDSES